MASEQPTRDTTARPPEGTASDHAPADNTARTHESGAPTEEGGEGEELWDLVPYDDDEYKKVNDTEAKIVETVQKAFSHLDREAGAPTVGKAGGSVWKGAGTWNGMEDDDSIEKQVKSTTAQVVGTFQGLSTAWKGGNTWKGVEDDDSIEKQMKNTTAQVVGTFQGLSTALQQAGEKVNKMWGQDKDSSKN